MKRRYFLSGIGAIFLTAKAPFTQSDIEQVPPTNIISIIKHAGHDGFSPGYEKIANLYYALYGAYSGDFPGMVRFRINLADYLNRVIEVDRINTAFRKNPDTLAALAYFAFVFDNALGQANLNDKNISHALHKTAAAFGKTPYAPYASALFHSFVPKDISAAATKTAGVVFDNSTSPQNRGTAKRVRQLEKGPSVPG